MYSLNVPSVVTRPILWAAAANSVNQRAASGPAVIALGVPPAVGIGKVFVITPSVVIRPMLPSTVVNHKAPSGPAAIPSGPPLIGYSVIVTAPAAGTPTPRTTSVTSAASRAVLSTEAIRRKDPPMLLHGTQATLAAEPN